MRRLILIGLMVAGALVALVRLDIVGRQMLALGFAAPAAALLHDPAWRGVALYQAGRFEEAERVLRDTRSVEAAYNLGNALARSGQLGMAVKAYDLALRRNPDDADARANRTLVLAALEQDTGTRGERESGTANATATKEKAGDSRSGADAGIQSSSGDGMAGQRDSGSDSDSAGANRVDRNGAAQEGRSEAGMASSKGAATNSAGRTGRGGGQTTVAHSDKPPPKGAPETTEAVAQATVQWLASLPDDPVRFLRLRIKAEHQRRASAGIAVAP
ncbi:MAG TPA: tetratricopeptide repeat protein [Ancylobacter sp.]